MYRLRLFGFHAALGLLSMKQSPPVLPTEYYILVELVKHVLQQKMASWLSPLLIIAISSGTL